MREEESWLFQVAVKRAQTPKVSHYTQSWQQEYLCTIIFHSCTFGSFARAKRFSQESSLSVTFVRDTSSGRPESSPLSASQQPGITRKDGIARIVKSDKSGKSVVLRKVKDSGLLGLVFWPGSVFPLNPREGPAREELAVLRRAVDLGEDSCTLGFLGLPRPASSKESSSGTLLSSQARSPPRYIIPSRRPGSQAGTRARLLSDRPVNSSVGRVHRVVR